MLAARFFNIGFQLIGALALTLLLSSLTLLVGAQIGSWQFPLAVLLCLLAGAVVTSKTTRQRKRDTLIYDILIPLLLIVFSIAVAACFYDVSHDGQAYHQETLIQLKAGWNPYWDGPLPESVNQAIWINHYAKGMEIVQSAIYCTIGRIEAGKATNILLWLGSFFLVLSLLYQSQWNSFLKKLVVSALFASNPVVINQLFTYYVDGVLASLLLCLLVTFFLFAKEGRRAKVYLLYVAIFVLAFNVKFTAVVYVALLTTMFIAWLAVHRNWDTLKKVVGVSAIAAMFAIMAGYNPYITNTTTYGHPFYPLMGANKVDIMTDNLPVSFQEKSGAEKFLISLFSHTDNVMLDNGRVPKLKIPFTFNKTDIASAPKVDVRIGGFGPLFSGILLLSTVLFGILIAKFQRGYLIRNIGYLLFALLLSIIIIPESWWARYVPQLWFIPIVILLSADAIQPNKLRWFTRSLYVLLVINVGFTLTGILWNLAVTSRINYQLRVLKSANEPIVVQWGSASSNRARFWENDIPYIEQDLEGVAGAEGIVRSSSRFIIPDNIDNTIEIPLIIKWTTGTLPGIDE